MIPCNIIITAFIF